MDGSLVFDGSTHSAAWRRTTYLPRSVPSSPTGRRTVGEVRMTPLGTRHWAEPQLQAAGLGGSVGADRRLVMSLDEVGRLPPRDPISPSYLVLHARRHRPRSSLPHISLISRRGGPSPSPPGPAALVRDAALARGGTRTVRAVGAPARHLLPLAAAALHAHRRGGEARRTGDQGSRSCAAPPLVGAPPNQTIMEALEAQGMADCGCAAALVGRRPPARRVVRELSEVSPEAREVLDALSRGAAERASVFEACRHRWIADESVHGRARGDTGRSDCTV